MGNFVELQHGHIEVKSRRGEGSTFTLDLPVDFDEVSKAHRASPGRLTSEMRRLLVCSARYILGSRDFHG